MNQTGERTALRTVSAPEPQATEKKMPPADPKGRKLKVSGMIARTKEPNRSPWLLGLRVKPARVRMKIPKERKKMAIVPAIGMDTCKGGRGGQRAGHWPKWEKAGRNKRMKAQERGGKVKPARHNVWCKKNEKKDAKQTETATENYLRKLAEQTQEKGSPVLAVER